MPLLNIPPSSAKCTRRRWLIGLGTAFLTLSLSACGGETVSVSLGSNSSTKPSVIIGSNGNNGGYNNSNNGGYNNSNNGGYNNSNNGGYNNSNNGGYNNSNNGSYNSGNNSNNGGYSGGAANFGVQQKTSGCRASGGLQDSACTPGAIISTATVAQICQSGYSSGVRNVPTSEKDQVYLEYGIHGHQTGEYEVDHLISLELGGSNDISNLWPEASSPKPGFHEKDSVENYLHAQVCSGAVSLADAQRQIATNWLVIYQQKMQSGR